MTASFKSTLKDYHIGGVLQEFLNRQFGAGRNALPERQFVAGKRCNFTKTAPISANSFLKLNNAEMLPDHHGSRLTWLMLAGYGSMLRNADRVLRRAR